jgi:hypothetical protein
MSKMQRTLDPIEELQNKSFANEIQDGANTIVEYLNRGDKVSSLLLQKNTPEDRKALLQEKGTIELYKRMLLMLVGGDLIIHDKFGWTHASDNKLPICSYLNSGSRVFVELPRDPKINKDFINWLSSGDRNVSKISQSWNRTEAFEAN